MRGRIPFSTSRRFAMRFAAEGASSSSTDFTSGKLEEIVLAAAHGIVRMVPEFAHWGNKAWFSIFRSHLPFFKEHLSAAAFEALDLVLPDSHLILSKESFPCTVDQYTIETLGILRTLPKERKKAQWILGYYFSTIRRYHSLSRSCACFYVEKNSQLHGRANGGSFSRGRYGDAIRGHRSFALTRRRYT